jgi:hypothetical protein
MRPIWKLLFVLAGLIAAVQSLAAGAPTPTPTQAASSRDLASLIQAAKGDFRRPKPGEVAGARQAVLCAGQVLVRKLALQPDGQSQQAALGLNELAAAVSQSPADISRLEQFAAALGRRRTGVQGAEFESLRAALRRYLQCLRAEGDQVAEEYSRQIDRLAAAWESYRRSQSAEAGAEIQVACRWLDEHGQAQELVQSLRKAASHPNHRMQISAAFLERALARDIRQPLVSNESSQGAQVSVKGQIKGKLVPSLVPSDKAGAVRVQFVGTGDSRIVANKGPVTVQARGRTGIQASEVAYLTERGLSASAPQVAVQHRSTPYAVGVNMRSRLLRGIVSKIVWRVAGRQQAESDRQAARNTQQKIDAEVRSQTAKLVAQANDVVRRFGVFSLLGTQPEETLKISTTARHLQWLGHYASPVQFAAPTPAPSVAALDPAVLIQLHETAVNNSESWLASRTINDSDFRELVFETIGLIPARQEGLAAQIPSTITFADEQPLTVRIDDDKVNVTLRLKAFASEGREFTGKVWTVRTAYQPQVIGGHVALVRVSPIAVLADSAADAGALQATLSRFLVERAASNGISSPSLASLPPLAVGQLTMQDGWFTLALVVDDKAVAARPQAAARR